MPFRDAASARHYLREPSHAFERERIPLLVRNENLQLNHQRSSFFLSGISCPENKRQLEEESSLLLGNDNSVARNGRDGRDLRNRTGALPHCWRWGRLLESEQGLLRLIPHA